MAVKHGQASAPLRLMDTINAQVSNLLNLIEAKRNEFRLTDSAAFELQQACHAIASNCDLMLVRFGEILNGGRQ